MSSSPIITFLPELILIGGIMLFVTVGSFLHKYTTLLQALHIVILLSCFSACLYVFNEGNISLYQNSFAIDSLSLVAKMFILSVLFFAAWVGKAHLARLQVAYFEFYSLILVSLLGIFAAVSSKNLITTYLAIELLSMSFYGLVALQRNDSTKSEVAMKYFILGALSSGVMLYGISMIYAQTASFAYADIVSWGIAMSSNVTPWYLMLGSLFLIIALSFKLGLFPFHQWMPDVYHGANTATVLHLSLLPKFAVGIIALRFIEIVYPTLNIFVSSFMMLIAISSIVFGSIVAISQSNIKRLLAYSTVAHMGFFFLSFVGPELSHTVVFFYLTTYIVTNLLIFTILVLLDTQIPDITEINELRGLAHSNPSVAFGLLVGLFSLAGIPPFIGFYAKLNVVNNLITHGAYAIAVAAVLTSVVAVFYYLRVIKVMYFEEPSNDLLKIPLHPLSKTAIYIIISFVLFVSLYPQFMYSIANIAFTKLL